MSGATARMLKVLKTLFGIKPSNVGQTANSAHKKNELSSVNVSLNPEVSTEKNALVVPSPKIDHSPISEEVSTEHVKPTLQSIPSSQETEKKESAIRVFQTIKPHVPLIKFRKGLIAQVPESVRAESNFYSQPSVIPPLESKTGDVKTKVYSLEWWQTPAKFKRRSIDELECDAINSGGGDKLWQ